MSRCWLWFHQMGVWKDTDKDQVFTGHGTNILGFSSYWQGKNQYRHCERCGHVQTRYLRWDVTPEVGRFHTDPHKEAQYSSGGDW